MKILKLTIYFFSLKMIYFLLVISNTKNPNTVDNNEPDKTPILTPQYIGYFLQMLNFLQINSS